MIVMNSQPFEPRQVAAHAAARWTLQALELIARAPIGLGLLLLSAIVVDRLALDVVSQLPSAQAALVCAISYWPVLAMSMLIARSSDTKGSRPRIGLLWQSAISAAVIAAGICAIGAWRAHGATMDLPSVWPLAIHWGGLASYLVGAFFLPLMAFSPAARQSVPGLSWCAHRRNLTPSVALSLIMMVTSTLAVAILPPALTPAVITFHGALFYVAYREIFEGRARNLAARPVVQQAVSLGMVRSAPCQRPRR
jgi:hypothetical protein